jgi:hypothetical protein
MAPGVVPNPVPFPGWVTSTRRNIGPEAIGRTRPLVVTRHLGLMLEICPRVGPTEGVTLRRANPYQCPDESLAFALLVSGTAATLLIVQTFIPRRRTTR